MNTTTFIFFCIYCAVGLFLAWFNKDEEPCVRGITFLVGPLILACFLLVILALIPIAIIDLILGGGADGSV